MFPELNYDSIDRLWNGYFHGTSSKYCQEGHALLKALGMRSKTVL